MGAVKRETPGQNRGCHEYDYISLSDPSMIETLIKFRKDIYPPDSLEQGYAFKESMTCLYIDIENLIKKTSLTKQERNTLALLLDGWSLQDIADEREVTHQSVSAHLHRACKKMAKLHNQMWLSDINLRYKNCPLYLIG